MIFKAGGGDSAFLGQEGTDYCVDEEGVFYLTKEQSKRFSDDLLASDYFCYYSYFPRWEGMLPDGKNAFHWNTSRQNF